MARPKAATPSRRYHISGKSIVTLDGRDIYLGKHDSPEALAKHAVLIAIYQQNGCRLPDDFAPALITEVSQMIRGRVAPAALMIQQSGAPTKKDTGRVAPSMRAVSQLASREPRCVFASTAACGCTNDACVAILVVADAWR